MKDIKVFGSYSDPEFDNSMAQIDDKTLNRLEKKIYNLEKQAEQQKTLISDLEKRIINIENVVSDEVIRLGLNSIPLKFEFMRQRGMNDLDEVHAWMVGVTQRLRDLVK